MFSQFVTCKQKHVLWYSECCFNVSANVRAFVHFHPLLAARVCQQMQNSKLAEQSKQLGHILMCRGCELVIATSLVKSHQIISYRYNINCEYFLAFCFSY